MARQSAESRSRVPARMRGGIGRLREPRLDCEKSFSLTAVRDEVESQLLSRNARFPGRYRARGPSLASSATLIRLVTIWDWRQRRRRRTALATWTSAAKEMMARIPRNIHLRTAMVTLSLSVAAAGMLSAARPTWSGGGWDSIGALWLAR